MLQNDALWDKGLVHCEICATGLLATKARYWCVWAQFIWFKWYLDNNGLNDTLTIIILCRVFCYDWPCNNGVRLFVFIRLNTCIVIQYYSYIHDTLLLPYNPASLNTLCITSATGEAMTTNWGKEIYIKHMVKHEMIIREWRRMMVSWHWNPFCITLWVGIYRSTGQQYFPTKGQCRGMTFAAYTILIVVRSMCC